MIAGSVRDDSLAAEIKMAAAGSTHVQLFLEFIDNRDLQTFFRAADLIVLPYTDILNSGSAILALSFDRPILVPAQGSLPELEALTGPDWVRLYGGQLTAEVLREALHWARERPPGAKAPLQLLDWDRIAQLTLTAFCDAKTAASRVELVTPAV
jgi:hypothetical protein